MAAGEEELERGTQRSKIGPYGGSALMGCSGGVCPKRPFVLVAARSSELHLRHITQYSSLTLGPLGKLGREHLRRKTMEVLNFSRFNKAAADELRVSLSNLGAS